MKEGDYLLAIDGQPVRVPDNYFRLLQVGKSDTVALTVGSSPERSRRRARYRVEPGALRPRGALRALGQRQRRARC